MHGKREVVIAATKRITRDGDTWSVPSQGGGGRYAVTGRASRCTCPDFKQRDQPCKHIFAVEYVERREEHADGTVTETRAVRVTYSQHWSAYNAAQTTEKETFCKLLRDLVSTVPSPEPKATGRPRLPLGDMLFSAAFKVYSTVSGRSFQTDLRAAAEKGFIAKARHYNSVFNVIATGFGTNTHFRYEGVRAEKAWVKTHAMVGVKTNVIAAVVIGDMNASDNRQFPALVEATTKNFKVREFSADKAYVSKSNLALVESKGATPYIPMMRNAKPDKKPAAWNRLCHLFACEQENFAAHYHKRSNVEATSSMVKRVFGDSVQSKTPVAQVNKVLLKLICHNVRVLIHEMHELGVAPIFGPSPANL